MKSSIKEVEEFGAVVLHTDTGMVVQVAPHARKVDLRGDTQLREFPRWADAGAEKDGRRAVGAGTQDNHSALLQL